MSSYKSLFIYFEIEKKGEGVVQGSDYILVRSFCIYILQHDTNVSMYLDDVTVMSFVLKKAISIQYILYLLSAPTHPPSSRGNSRRRTGNLFVSSSHHHGRTAVVAMANDLAPFSHFSPLLPLLHNTKVCTNLPISCTKWSLTSWTQRVGTKGLLWKVIWNDFWFGKQCTNRYYQKFPY